MRLLFDNCFHLCDMMIQDSTNTFTSFVLIISWKICASDSTSTVPVPYIVLVQMILDIISTFIVLSIFMKAE